eukprot:766259-Hanusia_phi.AAC.8
MQGPGVLRLVLKSRGGWGKMGVVSVSKLSHGVIPEGGYKSENIGRGVKGMGSRLRTGRTRGGWSYQEVGEVAGKRAVAVTLPDAKRAGPDSDEILKFCFTIFKFYTGYSGYSGENSFTIVPLNLKF